MRFILSLNLIYVRLCKEHQYQRDPLKTAQYSRHSFHYRGSKSTFRIYYIRSMKLQKIYRTQNTKFQKGIIKYNIMFGRLKCTPIMLYRTVVTNESQCLRNY